MNQTPAAGIRYNRDAVCLILPDQKRLKDAFQPVMSAAGLVYEQPVERKKKGITRDTSSEIIDTTTWQLRSETALDWIADGTADLAIVGKDTLTEWLASGQGEGRRNRPEIILTMDRISRCRMSLISDPSLWVQSIDDINEMRIATKYPATLKQMLDEKGVRPARIIYQNGEVESAIETCRADMIFEVIDSGNTLKAYGLEEKLKDKFGCTSSAVLVRTNALLDTDKEKRIAQIGRRLETAATQAGQPGPRARIVIPPSTLTITA